MVYINALKVPLHDVAHATRYKWLMSKWRESMSAIFMAWIVLGISVISEVAGTIALRQSAGFTRIGPALLAGLFYIAAVWLMAIALRQLEMGVTYAVWAASGTAITALVGIAVFQEQASRQKLTGIAIILLGVLVLSIERTGDA
jgi:small multidrug resistance pump